MFVCRVYYGSLRLTHTCDWFACPLPLRPFHVPGLLCGHSGARGSVLCDRWFGTMRMHGGGEVVHTVECITPEYQVLVVIIILFKTKVRVYRTLYVHGPTTINIVLYAP